MMDASQVWEAVLRMPESERLWLVDRILESIELPDDLRAEIEQRVQSVRDGSAELMDWDEAREEILGRDPD